MQTRRIFYKAKKDAVSEYFGKYTHNFKSLRNVTNFYIRNVMSGIKKQPDERTDKEAEVISNVMKGIKISNDEQLSRFKTRVLEARYLTGLKKHAYIYEGLKAFIAEPTPDKWFLSYNALDKILKAIDNPVYRSLPSQMAQKAIRKTVASWTAYFSSLKKYKSNPSKFSGEPKIPKYIRSDRTTMEIPNQTASLSYSNGKTYLQFPLIPGKKICIGQEGFFTGKYVKTEVKPYKDGYYIFVTTDNGTRPAARPDNPDRVLGLDPGLDNFLTCAGNFYAAPFIINGKYLKNINRFFNKERARLMSELTRGMDSRHSCKHSRRLDSIDRKRDNLIRDFFYKTAHYICRYAWKRNVDAIVIGHNKNQKDGLDLHHDNVTQNFYCIPYSQFCMILSSTAEKYGIYIVVREESYTSKASAVDEDEIPTYGIDGNDQQYSFSGKRVKRGLYKTAGGCIVNADVNGALNIARKEFPEAFKNKKLNHAFGTVKVVGFKDLYPQRKRPGNIKKKRRRHRSRSRRLLHGIRQKKRLEYNRIFKPVEPVNDTKKNSA